MPLAREFFIPKYLNELWPANYIKKDSFSYSDLLNIISHFFSAEFKKYKKEKDYLVEIGTNVNIEEVFSFLDFVIESQYEEFDEKIIIQKSKKELISYVQSALDYFTTLNFDKKLYKRIISSLAEGDSIMTYNWDLLIETCLIRTKKGKELLSSLKEIINPISEFTINNYDDTAYNNLHKGYFLKLHGSINWAYCSRQSCLRHSVPFVYGLVDTIFITNWSCDYCGGALEPMLLPPHIHKTYKNNRLFSLQASIAYRKLSTAKEIIVIGYSFPDFDFEANSIFRKARLSYESAKHSQAFLQNVVIVNPEVNNPEYCLKVENIFGIKKSKKIYGQSVNLIKYSSINDFLKNHNLK